VPAATPGKRSFEILPRVLPFLAIIVGVLYAMYGGIATPSETAAVGALMCLVIAMVIYKLWNPKIFGLCCATAPRKA
jgi:C4-dicarboxylate transporter DctM subunit